MRYIPLTAFILLATTIFSYAQEQQQPASVTYDTLLDLLDQHPALEAVRQHVVEQREAAAGAGGLPDPLLMISINNYPADGSGGFDRFAMTSKSIGFVQKIPNGGVRAASVASKQQLAAKAHIAVSFTRQQLVSALNTALAELGRVARQLKLVRQDINLLKQESAYWDGRLQAGDSALDERSRVEAELAQAEARTATLQAEKIQFTEELNRLVSRTANVDVPEIFPLPWPNTLSIYPVLLAEKDVHIARTNVESAEADFGPNYQVGVTYAQRDNSDNFDGEDFITAQFGISIPLWASRNQIPKLRSAQVGVSRAQAMLADTKSQWKQKLATQFAKIMETQAIQRALSEKEKSIQTQITSLRGAYEADGQLDMLIAAKRSLLNLNLQLAELAARYIEQVGSYNAVFQQTATPETKQAKSQALPRRLEP